MPPRAWCTAMGTAPCVHDVPQARQLRHGHEASVSADAGYQVVAKTVPGYFLLRFSRQAR